MPDIAVLIPCYNEELAIAKVLADFARVLPTARLYVYDNNSSDKTAAIARASGAIVRHEAQQGKGHVVRRMFADIEADIYILVDGDDTYDASAAAQLVKTITDTKCDMVNVQRVENHAAAYRYGHRFGNWAISCLVGFLFGRSLADVLSGYRGFSRRFVKSFPALARGFEIETELTVHALQLRLPIEEIKAPYKERPVGSVSKLHTLRDGFKILGTLFYLLKEEKPLLFFGVIAFMLAVLALLFGLPVVEEYRATGLVPRLPTAVLAAALIILASLSSAVALILDSLTRARLEAKRMHYLLLKAPE